MTRPLLRTCHSDATARNLLLAGAMTTASKQQIPCGVAANGMTLIRRKGGADVNPGRFADRAVFHTAPRIQVRKT
jgi:hypothetical protein